MFRHEKEFNEKLLDLRHKKTEIVKKVSALDQEYYHICDLLQLDCTPPIDVTVQMDPEEFPET